MAAPSHIDWHTVLIPSVHPGETLLRGSVVYLFIFAAMRILRRQAGAIAISDLLVIVLIADAAQNAMADEYKSITDGLLLIATILFWDYALDWLAYRFPRMRPLLAPAPLSLIEGGRVHSRHLRQQMLSEDVLLQQLREHGVESPRQVKQCLLEGDGHISVIPVEGGAQSPDEDRTRMG